MEIRDPVGRHAGWELGCSFDVSHTDRRADYSMRHIFIPGMFMKRFWA